MRVLPDYLSEEQRKAVRNADVVETASFVGFALGVLVTAEQKTTNPLTYLLNGIAVGASIALVTEFFFPVKLRKVLAFKEGTLNKV